jgi:hypothetical protein
VEVATVPPRTQAAGAWRCDAAGVTIDRMSNDSGPKTSYELAMERLKKQDAEAGIESRPITDAQKAQIAEIRNFYEAKIAEAQVLHESNRRNAADLASLEAIEQEYRRDRERLASERDRKVEKARSA